MLELIQRTASRVIGIPVGGIVGFFYGAVNGYSYDSSNWPSDEIGFFALAGMIIGAIQFTIKGAYAGATRGLKAAIDYRKEIKDYYFANIDKNKQLSEYIKSLPNSNCDLLTIDEMKRFEKHLNEIKDEEEKKKLIKKFADYQAYIKLVCPLTKLTLLEHKDPITFKNPQSEIITYSYFNLYHKIKFNTKRAQVTKFADGSPINIENILFRGVPQTIKDFVNEVRERLSNLLVMKQLFKSAENSQNLSNENSAEPLSPRSKNLLQYMKNQAFWPTVQTDVAGESKTPENNIASSTADVTLSL